MPRKPRLEYDGAVYHIMSRGDGGDLIVADDTDRHLFLDALDEACHKTGWLIHAFCLLDNHWHLLCETPEPNLVSGMKWLQGTYAQRFNARHHRRGHVFMGRYKALPIDADGDGYFVTVSSYIHLNPYRAGFLRGEGARLEDYPWSSYPLYLNVPEKRPPWVVTERVLGELGISQDDRSGRDIYRDYLDERIHDLETTAGRKALEEEWQPLRRGWYLGDDAFRERLLDQVSRVMHGHRTGSYSGEAVRLHNEDEAIHLLENGFEGLGIQKANLAQWRKSDPRKMVLAWLIRKNTTMTNAWISGQLCMGHPSNVTNFVRLVDSSEDQHLEALRSTVSKILKS